MAGITGYGAGLMLLPILTIFMGPKVAIPMLSIIQLTSNTSRVAVNRKLILWNYSVYYGLGALPGAFLGVYLFTRFSPGALSFFVGLYVLLIPLLRRRFNREYKIKPLWFLLVGFFSSAISGFVGIVGPVTAPFFLALGLSKGAFVGTEAAGAVVVHAAKLIGYSATGSITLRVFLYGCLISPLAWLGSWIGKLCHNRMKDHHFTLLLDAVCIVFGLVLILRRP